MRPVRAKAGPRAAGGSRPRFLIEAYVPAGDAGSRTADELLALIRASPHLAIIGTVVIPYDEWLLCLVEAPSADAVEAIREASNGAVRYVEVEWLPSQQR